MEQKNNSFPPSPFSFDDEQRLLRGRFRNLLEIACSLSRIGTVDDLCRSAVELGRTRLGFDRLSLWLCTNPPHEIRGTFGTDENGNLRDERKNRLSLTDPEILTIVQSDVLVVLPTEKMLLDDKAAKAGKGQWTCAVIRYDKRILGYLFLDNLLRGRPISEQECEALSLFALTIANLLVTRESEEQIEESRKRNEASLRESVYKLEKLLGGTVTALSAIVETRDPYTAGHQKRVSQLAVAIAENLGLPKETVQAIKIAALVHDLGKLHVPTEILTRPGQLTESELKLTRIHASAGYEILKNIDFPLPVASMVLQHHERLDGSGYPSGLKGDEILPEARILAVADVVEAMTSYRPYRPPLEIGRVLQELEELKGTVFDATVVDACNNVFGKGFSFSQPEGT